MKRLTTIALCGLAATLFTSCGEKGGEVLNNIIAPKVFLVLNAENQDVAVDVSYDEANKNDVFIDLNGNLRKDTGEELAQDTKTYTVTNKQVTVFGQVKRIVVHSEKLVGVDVMSRYIENLDFSDCTKLVKCKITNAQELQTIDFTACPLAEFELPTESDKIAKLNYIDMSSATVEAFKDKLNEFFKKLPSVVGKNKGVLYLSNKLYNTLPPKKSEILEEKRWEVFGK